MRHRSASSHSCAVLTRDDIMLGQPGFLSSACNVHRVHPFTLHSLLQPLLFNQVLPHMQAMLSYGLPSEPWKNNKLRAVPFLVCAPNASTQNTTITTS